MAKIKKHYRIAWGLALITVMLVVVAVVLAWLASRGGVPPSRDSDKAPSASGSNIVVTPTSTQPTNDDSDTMPSLDPPPGKALLIVIFTPFAASVEVDGQDTPADADTPYQASVEVDPGRHEVSVKMPGFDDFTQGLVLEDGDVYPVFAMLKSNSPTTQGYYGEHPDDQGVLGAQGAWYNEIAPTYDLFPLKGKGFTISLKETKSGFYDFHVSCHVDVITRLACKSEVRATLFGPPFLLLPEHYVFVFTDA